MQQAPASLLRCFWARGEHGAFGQRLRDSIRFREVVCSHGLSALQEHCGAATDDKPDL
jgi:hypothetical protein